MMNETLEFLKALQKEMVTQDNDSQANPRFWVVGDYEWRVAAEGCGERTGYFCFDLCENRTLTLRELADELHEHLEEDENEDLDYANLKEYEDDSWELTDLVEDLLDDLGYDYTKHEESFEHIIHPNTFFLTKSEAKKHIELNHYHYSSKAHTYAMTAWRSPQVEKLYAILEETNWDALNDKENSPWKNIMKKINKKVRKKKTKQADK